MKRNLFEFLSVSAGSFVPTVVTMLITPFLWEQTLHRSLSGPPSPRGLEETLTLSLGDGW